MQVDGSRASGRREATLPLSMPQQERPPPATDANGSVITLAVTGGTVYAGGDFTSIGRETRNYVASLDAVTGGVTSWNPDAGGPVIAWR